MLTSRSVRVKKGVSIRISQLINWVVQRDWRDFQPAGWQKSPKPVTRMRGSTFFGMLHKVFGSRENPIFKGHSVMDVFSIGISGVLNSVGVVNAFIDYVVIGLVFKPASGAEIRS